MSTEVNKCFKFSVRFRLSCLKDFLNYIFSISSSTSVFFLQANSKEVDLLVIAIMKKGPLITVIFLPCRRKGTVGDSIM